MNNERVLQEYKRHLKDVENQFENNDFLPFSEDFFLVLKKTEKLTAAVYLLSDFLDDREEMKWEMRRRASCLLSCIISAAENEAGERGRFEACLRPLISVLKTALLMRFLTLMNYSILESEYRVVHEAYRAYLRDRDTDGKSVLSDSILSVSLKASPREQKDTERKGHNKGQYNKSHTVDGEERKRHITTHRSTVAERKKRQETIIRLLQMRGAASIKDIASVITDCSEKTIQRELLSLIARGVAAREGERRWSVYRLVSDI